VRKLKPQKYFLKKRHKTVELMALLMREIFLKKLLEK